MADPNFEVGTQVGAGVTPLSNIGFTVHSPQRLLS